MKSDETARVTCKVVYVLKKMIDDWLNKQLCHSVHADFSNSYLPLLMSVGTSGSTNSKIAAKLNISKQAASKVIKELEEQNLVRSEKCSTDGRLVMLYLTAEGEKFHHHIMTQVLGLEDQYKKIVGTKNYEIAIDVMLKLINFHEDMNKAEASNQSAVLQ